MSWFVFALLSANSSSFVSLFDKFLRGQKYKNHLSFFVVTGILSFFSISLFFPWINFRNAFGLPLFFTLLSGLFYFVMWFFFLKGFAQSEVSRATAIFQIRPIFTALILMIVTKEFISFSGWIAILLIVSGSFLCSYQKGFRSKEVFLPYLWIIFSAFLCSLGDLFSKLALGQMSPLAVYFLSSLGVLPLYLIFLFKKEVRSEIQKNLIDKKALFSLIARTVLSVCASIFFYFAISSDSAGLAIAVMGGGPFLVFIYSTLISRFFPKIIKENITPAVILQKSLAILLIVSGVVLINF